MSEDQSLDGLYDPKDKENTSEVLPEHECTMQFTRAEKKTTKAGKVGLALQVTLLDGPCEGKKIDVWLNLTHSNPDVVRYGRADFAKIRRAVFGNPETLVPTPGMLLYKPFRGLIGHKGAGEDLESFIKKYTHLGAGGATTTTTAPTTTPKTGW